MTNDTEFREWLEAQTQEVCVAIAYRAAMRVLPFAMGLDLFDGAERLALATFRAILTSGVAAGCPTPEVKEDVRKAAFSARSAAFSADAARSAAFSADAARSALSAAFSADAALSARSAFSAARSAAFSADAARSAAYEDTERNLEALAKSAIPLAAELAEATASYLKDGTSALEAGGPWAFWGEWYRAAMKGEPLDWKLQEQIALIPNEIWEAGVEVVAEAIDEIKRLLNPAAHERPENVPEVERKILRELVQALLSTPEVTADFALSSAETIRRASEEYVNNTKENCLPDEFAALDELIVHFERIAVVARSAADGTDAIAEMEAEIEALNSQVAKLEGDLKAALEKTLHGRFKIAAIEGLGKTVASPWVIGGLGYATCHFFGWTASDMTLANLRAYGQDLLKASPLSGGP